MDDELDWDTLCFDAHEASVEKGREEGRKAGRAAGYEQGRQLGQTTAIEYGMEIGFISGVVEALEASLSSSSLSLSSPKKNLKNEKVEKSFRDLRQLIDDFPDAQTVFQQRQHQEPNTTENNNIGTSGVDNDNDRDNPIPAEDNDGKEDVRQLIQRIRARFRLLTVQLKIPHLSLKDVMNNGLETSSPNVPTAEW